MYAKSFLASNRTYYRENIVTYASRKKMILFLYKGLKEKLTLVNNTHPYNINETVSFYENYIYKYFRQCFRKYKIKMYTIVINIKDSKNSTFFIKLLEKRIKPSQLLRMKATDMASDDKLHKKNLINQKKHRRTRFLLMNSRKLTEYTLKKPTRAKLK